MSSLVSYPTVRSGIMHLHPSCRGVGERIAGLKYVLLIS
jgi:hypothetical protein